MNVKDMSVEDIKVGKRRRDCVGDLTGLKESIRTLGLLQPVGVNSRRELVYGERRLTACKELGWEKIPTAIVSSLDEATAAIRAERDENTCRLEMTVSELVAIGKELETLEKKAAAERETLGKISTGSPGKVRDKVGDALGMSGKQYEKAKSVVDKAVPELLKQVNEGHVSVNAAAEVAKLPKAEQKKVVKKGPKAVKEKAKETKEKAASIEPVVTPNTEPEIKPVKLKPVSSVDAWGIAIQPHAEEMFKSKPKFHEAVTLLKRVRSVVDELCEMDGGKFLMKRCNFERSSNAKGGRYSLAELDNAIAILEFTAPAHTDCPQFFNPDLPHKTEGGELCPLCLGTRTTGDLRKHQVSANLISAMRDHYGLTEQEAD